MIQINKAILIKIVLPIIAVLFAAQALAPAPAEAAFRFGLGNSAAKRAEAVMDEAIPASPVLILPVSPLQATTSGQVIWPFGVQGGGHPQGHPGIDFQTVIGASVFASATAKVYKIEDDFTDGVLQKLIMLETANYQIVYVGSLINISVAAGDLVVKGQKIADLGQFGLVSQPYGFVHWGVNARSLQTAVCPYNLMSSESQRQLESLFARSTYFGQAQFPLICNPCPAGGCR